MFVKVVLWFLSLYDRKLEEDIKTKNSFDNSVRFFNPRRTEIKGNVKIGPGSYINSGNIISGKNSSVEIGENCAIGHNVNIISITHSLQKPTGSNLMHEESSIKVGSNVWIGSNVFIKHGIQIHDNAIIGANSVVVRDVEEYDIIGGVPAKFIK
ncbi:MAG: acyltransferase [Bacteroidia bacterium]